MYLSTKYDLFHCSCTSYLTSPVTDVYKRQLHNEMQKEVIHDWMNHFIPILNKYNTVKKKLKAKVTERKELNVKKEKASIFNPIQHIKLNQQLTTVTEEIEELRCV